MVAARQAFVQIFGALSGYARKLLASTAGGAHFAVQ
jgi:hypothetical protein